MSITPKSSLFHKLISRRLVLGCCSKPKYPEKPADLKLEIIQTSPQ